MVVWFSVAGGPVSSRGLVLVILTSPFWLEMFCGSMALQLSPVPRADALQPSPMPPGDHVVCSEDVPGSKRDSGMLAEGTKTGKSSCARAGQHQTVRGAQAAQAQQSQRTSDHPCLVQVTLGTLKVCTNILMEPQSAFK